MPVTYIATWKKAPFIRLLIALITGIIIQWQLQFDKAILWCLLIISIIVISCFFFIPFFARYKLTWINGIAICILFFSIGTLLTWYKDIRHDYNWIGNTYKENNVLIATLDETPVEKTNSIKANATVSYIREGENTVPVKGTIILYFKKELTAARLPTLALTDGEDPVGLEEASLSIQKPGYGSQIVFKKSLQEIKNSGNPGGFNFKRYSLFHGITHQVYLKPDEFAVLKRKKEKWFDKFLNTCREKVLTILRNNIKGEKELGLAEALLLGYKDDLDQTLVQSYTNTGVVHIIAISGMHLGLIYWLLTLLLKPIGKRKYIRWLKPVLIIAGLWIFSLLTGGSASILRSAVMFTCIVVGEEMTKRTSIFNTLACSAFILLCINSYWLWDTGFQLSYAAVLSIVIFMRPVYNLFYIKNKALDFIWKLNAVTIAAQILTLPLSIYHFHQFPDYFLLTNFVAVPLSSIIILCEIGLCAVGWIPVVAMLTGNLLDWMIRMMNTWIERIEALPFSLWDGLQITILQAILLTIFVTGVSYWIIEKSKKGMSVSLLALLGFFACRTYSFIVANHQQKIIIYNVPQRRAIDFVDGKKYFFSGDSDVLADDFVRNFHLKPARILYRITPSESLNNLFINDHFIRYNNKNIMLLDESLNFLPQESRSVIDLLVISKNPKLHMAGLDASFKIKEVVFDGSVPTWKLNPWKKECDSLHIPYFDVTEKGAFVMNFN